ncbi:MAG: oligosaccharide flippase family protein [bacterium]
MAIISISKTKSFLFDHQTVKQTIFKNTFWLGLAEGISRLATFALFIFVARILGATEYGKFSFVLAVVGLLLLLPGFVSSEIITREFSKDKEKEKEFSSLFTLKLLFGLASILFLFGISFFVTADAIIRKVIWIMSAYWILNSLVDIVYAFFRARQRMEYESFFKIFDALLTTGFGLFVIFKFPSIENLSYAYLLEGLVLCGVILLFFHFKIRKMSFGFNKKIWKKILSLSWPMALIGLTAGIYSQIDTVMMGFFNQITETGWYNASFKITRMALVPVALISQSFYPVLSKFFQESKDKLQEAWTFQAKIMIWLAFPLMAGGVVLAPRIIDFLYGRSYLPAIMSFQMLIIMTGVMFLYDTFRQVLIVSNQQKKVFWAILAGAIVNIALNLILIPRFSLNGAALATLFTNILIFFLFLKFILKYTEIKPFNQEILRETISALAACVIMYLIISRAFVYSLPVVFSILIGIATYFIALFIPKKICQIIKKR